MHVYHEFPKWKYHAEQEALVVESLDEERALGPGWHDSPAHVTALPFSQEEDSKTVISLNREPKKARRSTKA